MHINEDRITWAHEALKAFAEHTGQAQQVEKEPEEVVGDLLCDLMYYCQARSIRFEDVLERAGMHYRAEQTCRR